VDNITFAAAYPALPNPTSAPEGQKFNGWYIDGTPIAQGDTVGTEILRSNTATAQWVDMTYTVVFDANGGAGSVAQRTVALNEAFITLPSYTPGIVAPEGKEFVGWSLDKNAITTNIKAGSQITLTAENGAEDGGRVTFYAIWKSIVGFANVSLFNGSAVFATVNANYNEAMPVMDFSSISKIGYTFEGFYANDKKYYNADGSSAGTYREGDATVLFAKFEVISYTISYTLNGWTNPGSNPATYTVETETITLAAPTKEGYTSGSWTPAGTISKGSVGPKSFTVVEGSLIVTTYTVIYNGNGHTSGSMGPETHTVGLPANLSTNCFARTGYAFKGWATSSNGAKVYNDGQNVSNLASAGASITLFAVWEAVTVTVIYNANGGTGSMASSTHTVGVAKTLTANSFSKTPGYTFAGWAEESDSEVIYSNKQSVTFPGEESYTYYLFAVWQPITYIVMYDLNGGTYRYYFESEFTYDENGWLVRLSGLMGSDPDIWREGYTFEGWATTPTGGKVYNNNDCVFNLASTQGARVTLYAVWSANTYTVVFKNSLTNANIDSKSGVYGTSLPVSMTVPAFVATSAIAYATFEGYYYDTDWTSPYNTQYYGANGVLTNNYTYFKNMTIYAKWGGTVVVKNETINSVSVKTVEFGTWLQNSGSNAAKTPIKWIVMNWTTSAANTSGSGNEGLVLMANQAIMIAKTAKYDSSQNKKWSDSQCASKNYLNDTSSNGFIGSAFNSNEQMRLQAYEVLCDGTDKAVGKSKSYDKVFLPSYYELYFGKLTHWRALYPNGAVAKAIQNVSFHSNKYIGTVDFESSYSVVAKITDSSSNKYFWMGYNGNSNEKATIDDVDIVPMCYVTVI